MKNLDIRVTEENYNDTVHPIRKKVFWAHVSRSLLLVLFITIFSHAAYSQATPTGVGDVFTLAPKPKGVSEFRIMTVRQSNVMPKLPIARQTDDRLISPSLLNQQIHVRGCLP